MYLLQKHLCMNLNMKNYQMILLKYLKNQRRLVMFRTFLLKILWLYQKFFTLIGYGSCRYYPSCSEYALINFKYNPLLTAFYNTFTRILRCNQLFDGGIEYPLLKKLYCKPANLEIDSIKYWLVPNKKNHYYIIKNFSYKG